MKHADKVATKVYSKLTYTPIVTPLRRSIKVDRLMAIAKVKPKSKEPHGRTHL